ncbi:MAG: hypothetical protein R2708_28440, partial [Vicinamibacterales bacterium]
EAGLNFLIGVEQSSGLFFEFKIGALDSPELKFGVGWTVKERAATRGQVAGGHARRALTAWPPVATASTAVPATAASGC